MKFYLYCALVCLGATACWAQQLQLGEAPIAPASQAKPAASSRLTTSVASPCWYDTSNRSLIASAYNSSLAPNAWVPMGWIGSFTPANSGTTSSAFQNAVLTQINWVRALAGVPCINDLNATESAGDQQAAFMMMTNGQLSHYPPSSWANWTQAGATAAANSNLCLGINLDPGCVQQYMIDSGSGNDAVGHRRWILYPQTTEMGTGDVPTNGGLYQMANALWVVDTSTFGNPRPATRDGFVAWPPPGYSPYQLMPGRWSFSYPGADFSTATVTMQRNGAAIPLTLQPVANGYGENTIVWVPGTEIPLPPNGDTASIITVGNVLINGVPQTFTYQVIIFDPAVGVVPPPTADSVTPNVGSGISQIFTFNYSSGKGYTALNDLYVLFNAGFNSSGACFSVYDKPSNGFYLYNDAGTGVTGPLTAGAGGSLSNNQCTLYGLGSGVSGSGNTLSMTLNLSFTSSFAGAKSTFLYAADNGGLSSGWQNRGAWIVPAVSGPPTADSANPSSGSGAARSFAFNYSSSNGFGSLSDVYVLFNGTLSVTGTCWAVYDKGSAVFFLANDAGNAWLGPLAPGANTSIQNSQCTLNGLGSSVSGAGNTLTMTLNLSFKGAFGGAKNIFMYAADTGGLNSGWQNRGTWTVPANNAQPTADSVTPNTGNGASRSFAFSYSSGNGFGYLSDIYALFNGTLNGAGACWIVYDKGSLGFLLANDAGSVFMGPLAPGANATLQNSQCALSGIGSSVSGSGNTLSMTLNLSFTNSFLGTQTIFMYAADSVGLNSGWQNRGAWVVPPH